MDSTPRKAHRRSSKGARLRSASTLSATHRVKVDGVGRHVGREYCEACGQKKRACRCNT